MRVTATCKHCGEKIDLSNDAFAVVHLELQIHNQAASYPEYHLHWPKCAAEQSVERTASQTDIPFSDVNTAHYRFVKA